jgi:hypothetical protein
VLCTVWCFFQYQSPIRKKRTLPSQ